MSYSKSLLNSNGVAVTVAEDAGVASLTLAVGAQAGGGEVAGFAGVSGSLTAQVSAIELANAGLDILGAKFPAAASLIAGIKAIVDAEAQNI